MSHEGFNSRRSLLLQPLQEKESILLLSHLLRDPTGWIDHVQRSTASSVLNAVYGWKPIDNSPSADAIVKQINDFIHDLVCALRPGASLVDIFPILLHLPDWCAPWKRDGKRRFQGYTQMFEGYLEDVRRKMVSFLLHALSPNFVLTLAHSRRVQLHPVFQQGF